MQCSEERVDGEDAVVEVELAAVQAGEFAPAAAGPGGGDDEQVGHAASEHGCLVGDADDLLRCGPDPFGADVAVASSAAAVFVDWVGGDESLVGGVGEDHRQQVEQACDGGGGVALGECFGPEGDIEGADGAERCRAEVGQDVAAQFAAVALDRAFVQVEGGQPALDPLGEGRPTGGGVDPCTAPPIGGHVGKVGVGVLGAAESAH
nr:hypothetical protein [Qaidamihabitans albus]